MGVERKLDIFDVLKQLDTKNFNYFSALPEEQQKAFHPLVVMRWMSGIKDERQIVYLNEIVNPFIFTLAKDKNLLYKLLSVCSNGKRRRYIWNKTANSSASFPNIIDIIKQYYGYSTREAQQMLPILNNEDILELADELGAQKDIVALLKKEFKKR